MTGRQSHKKRYSPEERGRQLLLRDEQGTIYKDAPVRVALVYPSPYRVAMSSLGYQTLYRLLNEQPGLCCERAMLSGPGATGPLRTLETGRPLGDFTAILISVATEVEVATAARALAISGLSPLESERRALLRSGQVPLVVAGGPLTYADGSPLCAIADVVISGEAEESLCTLAGLLTELPEVEDVLERCASLPGATVPSLGEREVASEPAVAGERWLPAFSAVITKGAALRSLFLIEPARGCPRRCAFCVMEPSQFRAIEPETVLRLVPEGARRVGLVGSALGDHPRLKEIVRRLAESGRRVSLSSLRADLFDDELAAHLVRSGARTLTVAADGASERLRRTVHKKITEAKLLAAAEVAAAVGLHAVKLYAMVGLPTETEEDILELCDLARRMASHRPVSLAVSPFVPKARTSLAGAAFAPPSVLRRHLSLIRNELGGHVELRATSIREAWIENAVARGGFRAGLAAIDVAAAGCTYAAWREAAARYQLPTGEAP